MAAFFDAFWEHNRNPELSESLASKARVKSLRRMQMVCVPLKQERSSRFRSWILSDESSQRRSLLTATFRHSHEPRATATRYAVPTFSAYQLS